METSNFAFSISQIHKQVHFRYKTVHIYSQFSISNTLGIFINKFALDINLMKNHHFASINKLGCFIHNFGTGIKFYSFINKFASDIKLGGFINSWHQVSNFIEESKLADL